MANLPTSGQYSYQGDSDASSAAAYGGKTGMQIIDNSSGGMGGIKVVKILALIGGIMFLRRLFKK